MDTGYEDKMYRQIEKSISNNINDKLFIPIELIDKPIYNGESKKKIVDSVSYEEKPIDEYSQENPRLSRAEYILQAREACLRQINSMEAGGRVYDNYKEVDDAIYSSHGKKKRDKMERLFNEEEDANPEEVASFKSLIIRTICAAVIFISIFIIDKVKVDFGAFSYETIRQYVIGNNQLKALEEILVSWLK